MNFTEEQIQDFNLRIDKITPVLKPKFGSMNVHQMVCHCADFFRMAKGIKKANEYGGIDENEIISLAKLGKTTPTPKGFDQVAGEGTVPTNLEIDKQILKDFIHDFATLNKDHQFAEHPFFGNMERNRWVVLASYHLNHHLKQFGV